MTRRLEVIKWEDTSGGNTIVHRVPAQGMAEIKLGARCIVMESQAAVFFRNGKAMDTLRSGTHTLTTENIPLVSELFKLVYQDAPFQSAVYYCSLKPFRDLKWGTKEPILLEDTKFGFVNVRAFGKFSVRVSDPGVFINEVVGTERRQDAQDIEKWFKDVIVARFSDLMAEYMTGKSVLQLQAKKDELAVGTKARTQDDFAKYGIELYDFLISSISLPESVKKAIDARSSMGALGIGPGGAGYMQMMAANAIGDAAKNPGQAGGMMNAGMGMGMGMMMPQMMAGAFGPQMGQMGGMYGQQPGYGQQGYGQQPGYGGPPPRGGPPPLPGAPPPMPMFHASINGAQQGPLDANAIHGLMAQGQFGPQTMVWSQGMAGWTPAGQVPQLAGLFAPPPPMAGGPPMPSGGPPPMPPPPPA